MINDSSTNNYQRIPNTSKKTSTRIAIPELLCFVIEESLIMGMLISMFCLV